MIQFGCPGCNTLLQAPERKAGKVQPCSGCGAMVQVPANPDNPPRVRPRRETWRAFWALCRFFLWGICLAAVIVSVLTYFDQMEHQKPTDNTHKLAIVAQALFWIFSAYFVAKTFDSSTKSLEELCGRLRRRRQ